MASDGKWYPPEAWTGPPLAFDPVRAPGAMPGYPAFQGPPASVRTTNGMAVAALVCGCAGVVPLFFGIPCILGIIFGFVARAQIRNSNGAQGGSGMALAGIIVGFSLIALFILALILVAVFGHGACTTYNNGANCTVN